MKKNILALLLGVFFLNTLHAQTPTVIYVNAANGNSTHDGQSWATAFTDLQSAIQAANPTANAPVQIRIAGGTYLPTATTDRSASFVMKNYLQLLGGFAGNESSSNRFYAAHPTRVERRYRHPSKCLQP